MYHVRIAYIIYKQTVYYLASYSGCLKTFGFHLYKKYNYLLHVCYYAMIHALLNYVAASIQLLAISYPSACMFRPYTIDGYSAY